MIETRLLRFGLVVYAAYMTFLVVTWAMTYAENSQLDGVNIGLVIAAVNGPIIWLNGYLANKAYK